MIAADASLQFQQQYLVIVVGALHLDCFISDGLVLLFRNGQASIKVMVFFVFAVGLYHLIVVFGIYLYHS